MPTLAQGRQGTLLPRLRRTSVCRAHRFSLGWRPLRADCAAFHDRRRSPRRYSLGCLVRRFRGWQPLRDSVNDPGRELGHSGVARLGVAGGEVRLPRRLLTSSILPHFRQAALPAMSDVPARQLPPGRAEAARASARLGNLALAPLNGRAARHHNSADANRVGSSQVKQQNEAHQKTGLYRLPLNGDAHEK
jgi:hypothetical protein